MPNRKPPHREAGPHPITGQLVWQMSSTELRQRLVADALQGYATDIPWLGAAVSRIAERDGIDVDAAFAEVWQEVESLGGFMPVL